MEKEYDLYKKRYELYDSLFVQNNIDDILSIAENFLGNPIFILDTSYRLITRSHLAKCENSSIETHNGEDYLLSGIISLMKENKCMDTIYKTNNSFFHYSDENLIFCSIKVNGISIGYISVLQRNRDFEDEDLELTNILSNLLSIQIQKDNLFISNSGLDEEYYLMDLLVNDIDNLEYASERLKYSSFTLSKYNLILSIPFKQKYED
ncbi:PucR family transcriptional regulator, partial [Clostridium sp. 2-1]